MLIVIPIWTIGQITIFLKTQLEHRRDHFAIGNLKDQEKEDNTKSFNTQRWNPYITTTHRTFITILFICVSHFQIGKLLMKFSNLNSFEKSLWMTNLCQMVLSLAVPLYMFAKNKSMFQHLIYEILKMKRSQKLHSRSKPVVLSTCTDTTIKMTNDMIPNHVQEGTFNKVKEEPNHDYPKCLPYHDQKALLSAARLKNAGFQLSNNTPEDGNCLIHALKDQMR